jgi:hypothetical protein
MNKSRRILLFSAGIFLGSIMVYFALIRGRNRTYWLPGNRVKELIQKSKIVYSVHAKCIMDCWQIDIENMRAIIKKGDVNFKESNVRNASRSSYAVDGELSGNRKIRIIVTTADSVATIETAIDLDSKKDSCLCL